MDIFKFTLCIEYLSRWWISTKIFHECWMALFIPSYKHLKRISFHSISVTKRSPEWYVKLLHSQLESTIYSEVENVFVEWTSFQFKREIHFPFSCLSHFPYSSQHSRNEFQLQFLFPHKILLVVHETLSNKIVLLQFWGSGDDSH